MSTTSRRRRPPLAVLVALCALATLPPLLSYAGVSDVGAFRMFTRPFEQHVALSLVHRNGSTEALLLTDLEPHLSRDDRRVLRPGLPWAPGETAASLLDGRGAADLARLVCALEPDAVSARVVVERRTLPAHAPLPGVQAEVRCAR